MFFHKLNKQIEALDQQKALFDTEWEEGHGNLMKFYVKIIPLVMKAERCSIFIHDLAKQQIWLKCGTGVEEGGILLDRGQPSVVGRVIGSGEHLIVNDLETKSGAHKVIDKQTGFVTRSILCVPIKSLDGKHNMGAVQVLNKIDGTDFNDEDVRLVKELAHYLQFSIENNYFNVEATGILKAVRSLMSLVVSIFLWLVGLLALGIIIRVIWAGISHTLT